MKPVDIKDMDKLPGKPLEENTTFCFRCYPEVSCFNRCCRNLNLFLYPYDVLRLKKCLEITSDRFLEEYVDVVLREGNFFPDVLLRMAGNEEKTCPYLAKGGCRVYTDRPDACRTFPVEQGMIFEAGTQKTRMVHFFRPPDFCMGQHENTQWTPKTWEADQEAETYHKMTAKWAMLKGLFAADPWGPEGPSGQRAKMAFMATYNIDEFRTFLLKSSFLKRYKVKSSLLKKLKGSDVELLNFGFEWVKFFLWGISSKNIRLKS